MSETDTRLPEGRRFDRSRLRLGLVIAVIAGALTFLVMQGLGDATTFFLNADEAVARRDDLADRRFRLQGTVRGQPRQADDGLVFVVEYHCAQVPVRYDGERHELFKPGIPVVLEGAFAGGSETFVADRLFVRHTSEYRQDEADRLVLAEQEACPQ